MIEQIIQYSFAISPTGKTQGPSSGRRLVVTSATLLLFACLSLGTSATADSVFFSTGDPDGRIATASRPATSATEIESADDFILNQATSITGATFTGLIPAGAPLSSINQVVVEIYRVFPKDSNDPPSGNVPTRANSPSDVAFESRDSAAGELAVNAGVLNSSFTAANSVLNGINPKPNQTTGGEGAVRGQEVQFQVAFSTPISLPADHYFFIPQVQLANGDFYWLSAPKPISSPGTPFAPDLQSWIRNGNLDPDWLRVGTDIVGGSPAPTFNASFSLLTRVPDTGSTAGLLGLGMLAVLAGRRARRTGGVCNLG